MSSKVANIDTKSPAEDKKLCKSCNYSHFKIQFICPLTNVEKKTCQKCLEKSKKRMKKKRNILSCSSRSSNSSNSDNNNVIDDNDSATVVESPIEAEPIVIGDIDELVTQLKDMKVQKLINLRFKISKAAILKHTNTNSNNSDKMNIMFRKIAEYFQFTEKMDDIQLYLNTMEKLNGCVNKSNDKKKGFEDNDTQDYNGDKSFKEWKGKALIEHRRIISNAFIDYFKETAGIQLVLRRDKSMKLNGELADSMMCTDDKKGARKVSSAKQRQPYKSRKTLDCNGYFRINCKPQYISINIKHIHHDPVYHSLNIKQPTKRVKNVMNTYDYKKLKKDTEKDSELKKNSDDEKQKIAEATNCNVSNTTFCKIENSVGRNQLFLVKNK